MTQEPGCGLDRQRRRRQLDGHAGAQRELVDPLGDAALGGVVGGVDGMAAQHPPLRHHADPRSVEPAHHRGMLGTEDGARVRPLARQQGAPLQCHPLGQHQGVARPGPGAGPGLAFQHPDRRAHHHGAGYRAGNLGVAAYPGDAGRGRSSAQLLEQPLQGLPGGAQRQQDTGGQVPRYRAHRHQVVAVYRHGVAPQGVAGEGDRVAGQHQPFGAGNHRRVLPYGRPDQHPGRRGSSGSGKQRRQQLGIDFPLGEHGRWSGAGWRCLSHGSRRPRSVSTWPHGGRLFQVSIR